MRYAYGMTPKELGRLRQRLDLTQAAFAAMIGVAPNTVARWERGELGIRPTTARLITLLTQDIDASGNKKKGSI